MSLFHMTVWSKTFQTELFLRTIHQGSNFMLVVKPFGLLTNNIHLNCGTIVCVLMTVGSFNLLQA